MNHQDRSPPGTVEQVFGSPSGRVGEQKDKTANVHVSPRWFDNVPSRGPEEPLVARRARRSKGEARLVRSQKSNIIQAVGGKEEGKLRNDAVVCNSSIIMPEQQGVDSGISRQRFRRQDAVDRSGRACSGVGV